MHVNTLLCIFTSRQLRNMERYVCMHRVFFGWFFPNHKHSWKVIACICTSILFILCGDILFCFADFLCLNKSSLRFSTFGKLLSIQNLECNHMEELLFLRNRNESLENENVVLTAQNQDLMARVDSLITELSEKEAHWCDLEENLNLKVIAF